MSTRESVEERESAGPPVQGDDAPQKEEKPRSLLRRNRDFRWIWSGETVNLFGAEITVIALPSLAVLAFGEGALGVGVLVALQWIPFVLLAPVFGVLTDRLRRKPLMQVANVARFVILGSLPLMWLFGSLTVTHLYVAAVLKGVFDVVFQLAYQAYITQILPREDFVEGNAKTQMSRSLAIVFGRTAGGALVGALGAARALTADALSFLVSSFALWRIKTPEPEPTPSSRGMRATLADLRSGLVMTFGNRLLRYLTLMAMFGNLAVSMVLAMVIVYAYQDLGFNAAEVGIALGVGGAPVLAGALLSQRITKRLGLGGTLILTHAMLAVAFLILPLSGSVGSTGMALVVVIVSQGIATFTTPVANVGIMSMIQKATPPEAMGRMGGVALPLVWGANAAGPLLGAVVASTMANVAPFFVAAVLAAGAVAWVLIGGVYKVRDDVPEEERIKLPASA